jgi:hypothetical protein
MTAPIRLTDDGFYDDFDEPLPETGYYDEPPRRISSMVYVLGALFLVTALLVLWRLRG